MCYPLVRKIKRPDLFRRENSSSSMKKKKKKSTAHLPSFSSFKFSSLLLNYQHTVELLRTAFAMEAEQHKPIKAIATLAIVQWDVSF